MTAPALQRFVDQAKGDVLVLHDRTASTDLAELTGVELVALESTATHHQADGGPRRWAAVVLAVADVGALRRIVPGLTPLGRTKAVACWLTEADRALPLAPRPEWPVLSALQARLLPSGAGLTTARFERAVPAHAVLEELARHAVGARFHATGGLVVAAEVGEPGTQVPPDVVLTHSQTAHTDPYDVTGRAPVVVSDPDLLDGPLDEGVLNPVGFVQRPEQGMVDLPPDDAGRGATARMVADLRDHEGVRVSWDDEAFTTARLVAGLAMAGVPLVSGPVPDAAALRLGSALADALTADPELSDPLRREEHSIRLRRAALLTHSTIGWGARLAEAGGLPHHRFPSVSVVLATKRPDQLAFALRQIARQAGAEIELVVAAHGFTPEEAWLRERAGHPAHVVALPADTLFGDVLNAGVARSSGDLVVKMDDDDWYGPDFITDLLLARHYSGADITGMTAEFVYLEALDRTIRRNDTSERAARFVAGGTIMLERGFLAAVGGFRPVRRFVDAQLLAATRALGGSIYRTQGLGYVLRRSPSGHTWEADADYFLDPKRLDQDWGGFRPSLLLSHDPEDVPTPGHGPSAGNT